MNAFDITFWVVSTGSKLTVRVRALNSRDATDEAREAISARAGEHVVVAIREVSRVARSVTHPSLTVDNP